MSTVARQEVDRAAMKGRTALLLTKFSLSASTPHRHVGFLEDQEHVVSNPDTLDMNLISL